MEIRLEQECGEAKGPFLYSSPEHEVPSICTISLISSIPWTIQVKRIVEAPDAGSGRRRSSLAFHMSRGCGRQWGTLRANALQQWQ